MSLSPMMKHYLSMKEKYSDSILFYRLGDFYEMFFEDAKIASKELDLTLTGKQCGLDERAPMCGVPFHAAENYISKLVKKGYKVALCEQLTEPDSKKLVERDVVKVVTAGTVMENNMLEDEKNNYIVCIAKGGNKIGIAYADISTGEFVTTEFDGEKAYYDCIDFLVKLSPSQIITNEEGMGLSSVSPIFKTLPALEKYEQFNFKSENCEKKLKKQLNVASLDAFELTQKNQSISACGALLSYIEETQKRSLQYLNSIKYFHNSDYMILDANTRRNLELTKSMRDLKTYGSLLGVLDKTKTAIGARQLTNFINNPLRSESEINKRLDIVNTFVNEFLKRDLIAAELSFVKDIERLATKICYGNITPRDCIILMSSIRPFPKIKDILMSINNINVDELGGAIDRLEDVYELISNALDERCMTSKDNCYIKEGYNNELDELRNIKENGHNYILNMEKSEREKTGIKNLKIGFNNVFGYYIEVTKLSQNLVPLNYIRKQTLVNAERYITEELKVIEERILNAGTEYQRLQQTLFNQIREKIATRIDDILKSAHTIGVLDALISLATVSSNNNYVRPEIGKHINEINVVEGRHPVVESINKSERFVANDTFLDNSENRTMILTGPNMAGKSTYMRQVAIITLMAHIGCFVPAKSAKIPIVDRIFTRVGASDNLVFDQSTFMVEMTEVANILHNATKNSLIILDEVGRGTSTLDGLSIAWAVITYINEKIEAKTLFATHYHELTELENTNFGIKNFRISVKEIDGTVVFLRKVVRGGANKSFGIEVASLAGIPKEVINSAKVILVTLEKTQSDENIRLKIKQGCPKVSEADKNDNEIAKILKDVDINNLTPLDALSLVNELKEKINNL